MEKYDDIINLDRPKSKYPKMSLEQRSAQFAPFSAVVGYDEVIREKEQDILLNKSKDKLL